MKNHAFSSRSLRQLIAGLALGLTALTATAQSGAYPTKSLRLIVAYAPGGATDAVARKLASEMGDVLGQSVVVENRPGASGNIGADLVAKSNPDGYTLLFAPSTLIANPLIMKAAAPFDVKRDFDPLFMVASGPLLFLVRTDGPASVQAFVEAAKAAPRKFNFGTGGFGAAGHLSAELFKQEAGIKDVPVVLYKGTAPAITDIIGGQLSGMMEPSLSALPQIRGGRLKALAVASTQRDPLFPDVPTFAEVGLPGVQFDTWYGVWAPVGMPAAVKNRLIQTYQKVIQSKAYLSWLAEQGYTASEFTESRFQDFLDKETARYAQIVRDGRIQQD